MKSWSAMLLVLVLGVGVMGCPRPPVRPPVDEEGENTEGEITEGEGEVTPPGPDRLGGITVSFSRVNVTSPTGSITSVASFDRVEDVASRRRPALDSCRIEAEPEDVAVTHLRAGNPGRVRVGFQQAFLQEQSLGTGKGFVYRQNPTTLSAISVGQPVTVDFPAGGDLPEFELASIIVAAPIFSPPVINQNGGTSTVTLDFNNDLLLVWNDAEPGDYVLVNIFVNTQADGEDDNRTCTCALEDDGEFTIPVETLEGLGFVDGESSYSFLAQRVAMDELEIEVDDEPGVVALTSVGSVSATGL